VVVGAGLAEDIQKGIIARFRSVPLSQAAVRIGRTASDVVYNVLTLLIMGLTGLVVGWRIHSSLWEGLVGFGLLLAFSYAFSWTMALVGLLVPSVEVINNASFMVIFPVTFIANTFVPTENLPAVLGTFAELNPIPALTQAGRELFGNIPPGTPDPTAWPLQNPVIYTLIWAALIIAVFAPRVRRPPGRPLPGSAGPRSPSREWQRPRHRARWDRTPDFRDAAPRAAPASGRS